MNILHNLDNSNRGGIQEMILRLHRHSVHRHDFWAAHGSYAQHLRDQGMVLWGGGPPQDVSYDVVVGHTVGGWSNDGLAAWAHARGAKFVECLHSIAPSPTTPANVDAFVAVSHLAARANPHMPRVTTIYPPVDCDAFELPRADRLIGRLSRLVEEKRPEEFALLAREFHQTFILAGDGPERTRLSTSDNLHLVGWIYDLPLFYSQLGLFVFPTRDECACVSVAQAQAAGVPVICQDLPALRETTGGHAVFCHTHNDFVQAIRHYLDSPLAGVLRAQEARAWARRMFDVPVTVGAWDVLLEGLA